MVLRSYWMDLKEVSMTKQIKEILLCMGQIMLVIGFSSITNSTEEASAAPQCRPSILQKLSIQLKTVPVYLFTIPRKIILQSQGY